MASVRRRGAHTHLSVSLCACVCVCVCVCVEGAGADVAVCGWCGGGGDQPKFEGTNVDAHLSGLLACLKAGFKNADGEAPTEANCAELAYVGAFVDYYTNDANVSASPDKFDTNADIVTSTTQLCVVNKPPILTRLLKLLLIFSRSGTRPPPSTTPRLTKAQSCQQARPHASPYLRASLGQR
jgi:hypothetical protein